MTGWQQNMIFYHMIYAHVHEFFHKSWGQEVVKHLKTLLSIADMKDLSLLRVLDEPDEYISSVWALTRPPSPKPSPMSELPQSLRGENSKEIKGSQFAKFIAERKGMFNQPSQQVKRGVNQEIPSKLWPLHIFCAKWEITRNYDHKLIPYILGYFWITICLDKVTWSHSYDTRILKKLKIKLTISCHGHKILYHNENGVDIWKSVNSY